MHCYAPQSAPCTVLSDFLRLSADISFYNGSAKSARAAARERQGHTLTAALNRAEQQARRVLRTVDEAAVMRSVARHTSAPTTDVCHLSVLDTETGALFTPWRRLGTNAAHAARKCEQAGIVRLSSAQLECAVRSAVHQQRSRGRLLGGVTELSTAQPALEVQQGSSDASELASSATWRLSARLGCSLEAGPTR